MDIAGDTKCMLWRPIDSVLDMLEPPSAAPIMLIKQTPPECLRLLGQDQHLAVGLPSLQLAGSLRQVDLGTLVVVLEAGGQLID